MKMNFQARTDATGTRANPHTHTPPHPHTADSRRLAALAGFSLVEILVATTILLIIVMMISMVFQQTSGAYQSGTRRVRSQTVLRNILGAISRDMILAVDSRYYPGFENDFGSQSASFIALTGTPDGAGRRAPQWIEFSYAGGAVKRSCTDMVWQSAGVSKWILSNNPDGKEESTLNPNQNEKLTDFSFAITADPDGSSTLPLRVDVEGSIQTDGKDSYVSGRSAGKDRKWGTATEPGDDIIVGGQ
jgi:hypothetical protein